MGSLIPNVKIFLILSTLEDNSIATGELFNSSGVHDLVEVHVWIVREGNGCCGIGNQVLILISESHENKRFGRYYNTQTELFAVYEMLFECAVALVRVEGIEISFV